MMMKLDFFVLKEIGLYLSLMENGLFVYDMRKNDGV